MCNCSVDSRQLVRNQPVAQMKCLFCGEDTKNPKYCSIKHQMGLVKQHTKEEIEQGIVKHPKVMKAYLIDLYGLKCKICGITMWCDESVPLVLDHEDGNPYNWEL